MSTNTRLPIALLGLLLTLGLVTGCEEDTAAENLGENIEELGEDVQEGANDARRSIEDAAD
ncbi:MAG: hypothetical protein P1U54_12680 [Immundisolibacteraceae bacterium]|nr:hypothetical protein [Immundisolibacteraceae bacterium]